VEAGEPMPLASSPRLRVRGSNITQLVDRLEADKLVRRVHDAADRRSLRPPSRRPAARPSRPGSEESGRGPQEALARR